jgi:anthranilate synthase component II
VSLDVIKEFGPRMPLLGVCLGHQAIGLAFGGQVIRAPLPIHGKTSTVEHNGTGIFAGLTASFQAGRYHSLIVGDTALPGELEVTARTQDDGLVMGLRHRAMPIHGVQFHPESVLTNEGRRILRNFLEM